MPCGAISGRPPHVLIFPNRRTRCQRNWLPNVSRRFNAVPGGTPLLNHRGFRPIVLLPASDPWNPPGVRGPLFRTAHPAPTFDLYESCRSSTLSIDRDSWGLRPDAWHWCCPITAEYLPHLTEVSRAVAAEVPDSQFTFIEFGGGMGVTQMFRARLDARSFAVGLTPRLL